MVISLALVILLFFEVFGVLCAKFKNCDSICIFYCTPELNQTLNHWQVLIAIEKQRVSEKEAETQKKIAISEAEKHAHVSKIQMEQKLMEKDSARKQEEISNAMYLAREKSLADADYYR